MTEAAPDGMLERSPAVLAGDLRDLLSALRNAAHLLAVSRDDVTVERVRRMVARQVECLTGLADELDEALQAGRGRAG